MPRCRLFADQSLHKKFARKQAYALFSCRSCLLTSYVKSSVLTCVSPSVRAVISVSQNSNTFLSFVFVVQRRCPHRLQKSLRIFIELSVRRSKRPGYYLFLSILRSLSAVLGTSLFSVSDTGSIKGTTDDVVSVPGRSLTRPPRIKTTLCSCRL